MAQDIFLKINGIDGESEDASHKDEIEVLSWSWNVSQQSSMHAGSGGGAGRATVEDLTFEHLVDRATPNLTQYCLTGKHIDEAKLVVRKAGGNPLEYIKFTMNDVLVTSVSPSGVSASEQRPREVVRLSFSRMKQEYVVQNAQGGSGGAITATFDIKKNVA
ncbi:Hcp family type VI secretion system effector [Paraburkholderia caballeronis]|uniref:Type VI secretion system secreted protein Hcp n=1 Tax=Paraburkholderia caballeronis TaxID=416943 RepID=A0A1H7FTJ7_9BURK|nr:type VI secretion system tube protein Hcp [Paraburkholderia caballeronis]PXW24937.1 type VI secretion system secreted protein Hcp [Paraburkholderia caballeronis]PXX00667.1 type VI secretion system secreted protein Hcp [Paraburkholderia caballeronis]RAJ98730.1 type VI secretion system secreted protein Hcp [Paraburkholderia caballeronis]TDV16453.1 type VI secretion system secreted protein Hcp [Paraburkholderia caballeronis]TDV18849.1 type VI secretion system secreted protein Hcp [Paraburkhold